MTELAREMPKYRCHKEVHALEIEKIFYLVSGGVILYPMDKDFASITVDEQWVAFHLNLPGSGSMASGGYYVVYEDGYSSFSPRESFENGYTRIEE